ncbi:MAG: PQQ-binding-like beta-propeller repeat protein, partial [Gemmataceae bacterium]|nr:PQQ-binding-like beta-propeller repeat protein [Gemmataceae bacterium]
PLWTFKADRPGAAVAAPLVTGDAVYLAAVHTDRPAPAGAVYALDPDTGKPAWTFDRGGAMLPSAAAPLMAGGRLVVGEGLHPGTAGRCSGLDPSSGEQAWTVEVAGPVEGGAVALGKELVAFPAGDDGVVAVDPASGEVRWRYRDLHVGATPAAAGGKLFAGGTAKGGQDGAVVCLDAATGSPVWRKPAPMPAWHAAAGGPQVYVGLGTGRPSEGSPTGPPAGALGCYDAATGEPKWTYPAGGGVSGRPFPRGPNTTFGSRDGHLYMIWEGGQDRWKEPLGGPVAAGPVAFREGILAVTVPGRVVSVTPDGNLKWDINLAPEGSEVVATGGIRVAGDRLYIPAEVRPKGSAGPGAATLFCYRIPSAGSP